MLLLRRGANPTFETEHPYRKDLNMKKVLFVLSLLVSGSAFAAVGPNSSWDEIYQAGLWPNFPKVVFGSTFVPVSNVCVDGDNLRGGNWDECVRWESRGDSYECAEYRTIELVTPRTYTKRICAETDVERCGNPDAKYVEYSASYPLSYEVEVQERSPELERTLFTKHFEIPACN